MPADRGRARDHHRIVTRLSARRLALAAVVLCLLLVCGAIAASGAHWYLTSDFFCLWTAARFVDHGLDPYDRIAWGAATAGLFPDLRGGFSPASCPGRYGYPLWTAALMAPFGLLPLALSAAIWMALSIGAAIAGVALSWSAFGGSRRSAGLLAVLFVASEPLWLLLISGQLTGVALGIAGLGAYLLSRGRSVVGGAALALLALKPQIAAVVAAMVAARAALARRGLLSGGAAMLALLLAITLALRPQWVSEWSGEIVGRRIGVGALLPTAWGLSATLFGQAWLAVPMFLVVLGLVVAALWRRPVPDTWLVPIGLPLSLFATPYAWSYDHLVLAVSWAAILGVASRSRGAVRVALVLGTVLVASALPWALYAVAFARGNETLSAVIPAFTALLAALALRWEVRQPARAQRSVSA